MIFIFTTTPRNQFFPLIPYTYFATKFCTTLSFLEVFADKRPDTCSTPIKYTTNHVATLPKGNIGYFEVPSTNAKPKYNQVNDINTLVHMVAQTYQPDLTELFPTSNYDIA